MTLAVRTYRSEWNQTQRFSLSQKLVKLLDRLWWHTKALVPIVGILFLVLGSLIFLHLHWLYQSVLKISNSKELANARHTH